MLKKMNILQINPKFQDHKPLKENTEVN